MTIECFEKGMLSEREIGRPVKFSDIETVDYLVRKIVAREGIGDLLAEGVKKAAEKVGQGSDAFAIHVKGLEWTGYECRNAPSMMLAYMTADIGAHHSRAWVLGHDMAGAWTQCQRSGQQRRHGGAAAPGPDQGGQCPHL